ncbi:MAG TPA: DUF416 family protein [Chloroflexota bacterium]|nr:DUF416 family protein [Chloroflexota bacterium]
MGILRFNEESLKSELSRIAAPLRVVFAAAVAERLLPAYVTFSHKTGRGNPDLLTQILERLWGDIDGIEMSPEQLQQNIDLSMELIPKEDEIPWIPDQAWAEDAAVAVVYALHTRQNGKSQDAAWAARRAYDALDHFVTTQEDIDPSAAGAEEQIISNPLIQAEFMRQQRDLRELAAVDRQDEPTLVQKIRQRAKAESIGVFDKGP